ncbi:ABC transporter ATP-binding protein [Streptomyces massasporeus]|uniref:ABC transporter ATP-binding protein n=1 Tax=Streptomyces TaxID=1883 RepID=UPI001C8B2226|nr:ABC transporter ATP-binding protein [Streptomyces sp. WAC04114]MBX9364604.1 ABC transporter ATP-binding protein/permease [Streptomyces sp. WAC04114]
MTRTEDRRRAGRGTLRRILPYAARRRGPAILLVLVTVIGAVCTAGSPLLLKVIIDDGIVPRRPGVVLWTCVAMAGVAVLNAAALFVRAWCSGRIGESLVHDLRTTVFDHVQKQPLAFFTHAQTGALISRLNNDVNGARQAVTALLTQSVSALLTLGLLLTSMFLLSWQIALAALLLIPVFLIPSRLMSRNLQRLTREGMELDAEMSSLMTERFNVSGAMLAKLYGQPDTEAALFSAKAGRVRDLVAARVVYGRLIVIMLSVLTGLTTALVYGLGGSLAIDGTLEIGTLVALAALLLQVYAPINQLSTIQTTAMTALVAFDRLFEILDLEVSAADTAGPSQVTALGEEERIEAPEVVFEGVSFRYPTASEVSLPSLETTDRPEEPTPTNTVLNNLTFHAPAGRLTALVGPSGAGKTTITHLVPRLYDPTHGTIRIAGHDIRTLTRHTLTNTVGVVTQDAHLFHDTLRANLTYAKPDATEDELVNACRTALIWDTITHLPHGLDTIVGDRGYHLSGGEKQRISIARLLLKAPPVVVLDEATAHLDSESEAAIQQALDTALAGRTSLVIAHRLSTIRQADQILVINNGHIHEHGTHHQLLADNGLYADLYHTQYAPQRDHNGDDDTAGVAATRSSE